MQFVLTIKEKIIIRCLKHKNNFSVCVLLNTDGIFSPNMHTLKLGSQFIKKFSYNRGRLMWFDILQENRKITLQSLIFLSCICKTFNTSELKLNFFSTKELNFFHIKFTVCCYIIDNTLHKGLICLHSLLWKSKLFSGFPWVAPILNISFFFINIYFLVFLVYILNKSWCNTYFCSF